ncbi:hypothetical protein SynSYN20_02741 [Synechococcus sp. SYN20]|nr:hypothetical protein SynSYN20_02741 [Synechococcus sp. SYN20]
MADLINVGVEFLCPLWLLTTSLIRASSLGLSRLNSEQVSRFGGHPFE